MQDDEVNLYRDKALERLASCNNNPECFIAETDKEDMGVTSDMLEAMGLIEIKALSEPIRAILEHYLLISKSNWIRDGAIRGLSYLDDKQAIPVIEKALAQETEPRLKRYMAKVITGLRRDITD